MIGLLRRILSSFSAPSEKDFFNSSYYLNSYPDVYMNNQDGFQHFMKYGRLEGRNPSPNFVTLYYRDKHLSGSKINPLSHYVTYGIRDGLNTKPIDEYDYIAVQKTIVYPFFDPSGYFVDSSGHFQDPLSHYLHRGWREGAAVRTAVSIVDHVDQAKYVTNLNVSPLYHYASQKRLFGSSFFSTERQAQKEIDETASKGFTSKKDNGRDQVVKAIYDSFDCDFYLERNQDVRIAGINPLDHFVDYGWRENRKPNLFFDPAFYVREHLDSLDLSVNPFFHYLTVGRYIGLRPNPVGLRPYPKMRAPNEQAWASVNPANDLGSARCIVVVPIYKGYDETLAAIYAILTAPQATPFALHVIDDRSPDSPLSAKVASLASIGLFSLEINRENRGFVKTVNSALRRFPDQAVVLINTDAKVSGDWLDRMMSHADRNSRIATVTPFSNNATIVSYPLLNENNAIEMEVDLVEIDRLAAKVNAGRSSEIPVGVGFCFLISAAARKAIGIFDESAFGRGYGEECDFCLRASKAGFLNILAEDVFVYHVGQVSFGANSGEAPPGQDALIAKHPEYPELIRQHLRADQTEIGRIRLDLKRIAISAGKKPTVFVLHAQSGGIVTHVESETRRMRAVGIGVILIRVGAGNRWNLEILSGAASPPFTPNLRPMAFGQLREHLADFLRWLDPGLIHIHSLVGLDWIATTEFMDLVRATKMPYRFTLHDYSIVCHRNDLVLTNQRYCGLPDVERCRLCVATDRSHPETVDPAVRRETYSRFLDGADQVQAPSRDVADRLNRAGAQYSIRVVPHVEDQLDALTVASPADPSHISVVTIGAIGAHKGSRIILSLARDAKARNLPIRYHIVGYTDIADDLLSVNVTETGRFSDAQEAMKLTAALSPNLIFLPSIWPETWSYTLSMAFALHIRPVVFDIGAPADRIRQKGFGEILPYELIDDIKRLNDQILALSLTI